MLLDFIDEEISSLDHFDTSEVDSMEQTLSTDFDSVDDSEMDNLDYYDDLELEKLDDSMEKDVSSGDDTEEPEKKHYLRQRFQNANQVSFGGNGKCRLCSCGKWSGYGDVCSNCGHFYNKHI